MANDQEFRLKWNNFQSSVLSSFGNLLEYEELVDVTLACEGQQLKAHKVILCASSSYFRHLFKNNPCQHPIVFLKDVRFDDLKAIMTFVYHGEVNVSQDRLTGLLRTAESLKIKGLAEEKEGHNVSSSSSQMLSTNGPPSVGISKETVSSCTSPPQKKQRRSSSPFPPQPVSQGMVDLQLKKEPGDLDVKMDCVDVEDTVDGDELLPQDEPAQILDQDTMDTLLGGVISQEAMHSNLDSSHNFSGYVTVSSSLHPSTSTTHTTTAGSGCPYCFKVFSHGSNLRRHVRDIHGGQEAVQCSICGSMFKNHSSLDTHKRTYHRRRDEPKRTPYRVESDHAADVISL